MRVGVLRLFGVQETLARRVMRNRGNRRQMYRTVDDSEAEQVSVEQGRAEQSCEGCEHSCS